MKRAFKITFIAVLLWGVVLSVILVSLFLVVTGTEYGTQLAWRHGRGFLPAGVEVSSLTGRLSGPLEIGGLKITTVSFQLEMDRGSLKWKPLQLLQGVLAVESITAEGLRYTQLKASPAAVKQDASPLTLPEQIKLPLDAVFGTVSLRGFEFRSQPEGNPFDIVSAIFRATVDRRGVEISNLSVESSRFTVKGNALLAMQGDYPIQGDLQWQVPVPNYPAVNGHTLLSGSLRELTITQNIAEPYDVQGVVLVHNPVENLRFEVSLTVNPLELRALNQKLPPITVQVAATGNGDPGDMGFNLSGWANDSALGKITVALTGGFKAQTITFDPLTIGVAEQPAQITVRGQIDLSETPEIDLAIDWQHLQWPLKGLPLITSPQGKIEMGGSVNAYTLKTVADVEVPEQMTARVFLEGQGGLEALQLSRIDIDIFDGKLEGEAGLRWAPELHGDLELTGKGLNPGKVLKDWPGKLSFSLQAQGGLADDQPSLQLRQLSLKGELRGYEAALEAAGAYSDSLTTINRLALSSGSTQVEVSGTVSDRLDVSWQIDSQNLGTLVPGAAGRINGKGRLAGPLKTPQVAVVLKADDLAYKDYTLKSLALDADVDVTGKRQSKILLNANKGKAAGVELRDIALNGRGDTREHFITLMADTSTGRADIALRGELQNPWQPGMIWNFRVNRADFKYPDLDGWVLQTPSTGKISAGQAILSRSCWQSGDALLCLQGHQTIEKIQADFSLAGLPFSYISRYLPPDIDVEGNLSGKGTVTLSGNDEPSADFDLTTSAVRVLSRDSIKKKQGGDLIIAFQPADIQLAARNGGYTAGVTLPLSQTDRIVLKAAISPGKSDLMARPVTGQVTTEIQDLAFIADLIPDVQKLEGRLTGKITLAGSLESPVLQGRLALVDGGAELEGPGLNLKDVRVEVTGEGADGIRLTAHAVSEGGTLDIVGTSDLRGKTANADITVKGQNFRVVNTLEAQVDASPNLVIALRDKRVDVGGELVIPKAQITVKTLPESSVKASDDQVIRDSERQETGEKTTARELFARVRTVLGDDVRFDGFGLKARIQGEILAVDMPDEPTTASGELKIVEGEYRAYGQGLVIEKGRFLFAGGPINQPGLDVRAVRRPEEGITVGVQVRGTLKQPDFKLFSTPSMTQGNQLSYLVLGRPMSGTSGSEGSALSRAALAMGLRGGNVVAKKISGSLGLDQFGVDTGEAGSGTNPEKTSFVIGKYLSPKLYVSYGLGLFKPSSTLLLQYSLSNRWKIVTQSSNEASGGDVIYVIETGE